MRRSPTFSSDRADDDLYFEMEFPLSVQLSPSALSRLSVESDSGSRSILNSSESLCRYSRESSSGLGDMPEGAVTPPEDGVTPPKGRVTPSRERPSSLLIPAKTKGLGGGKSDLFCSLPRTKMHRVPKISLPNYSVPGTPRDSWEKRSYLGHAGLSGTWWVYV